MSNLQGSYEKLVRHAGLDPASRGSFKKVWITAFAGITKEKKYEQSI